MSRIIDAAKDLIRREEAGEDIGTAEAAVIAAYDLPDEEIPRMQEAWAMLREDDG